MKTYDHLIQNGITDINDSLKDVLTSLYELFTVCIRVGHLYSQTTDGRVILLFLALFVLYTQKRHIAQALTPIFILYERVRIRYKEKKVYYFKNVQTFTDYRKQHRSKSVPGVYLLYNAKKRQYYVGQAINLLERVNQHCTGSGKGNVFVDMEKGHRFTIHLIPLHTSSFKTLNDLERYFINYCNSYDNGYNKTRGNQ